MNKEKMRQYFIYGVLVCVFLIMHVYRIWELPYGIICDEMGMGYDAWCLSHFGTDRYQNSFPVYLINFSGGQSALYAYLCAPFVYFFGMNVTVFRIPAIICSAVTLIYGIKIITLIYGNNSKMKLLAFAIFDACPIFTMMFRTGLDCILMIGLSTMFLYYLLKAIDKQTIKSFAIAGIVAGITLYTYALSHFAMPVFLFISICYLIYIKKVNWKQTISFCLPLLFLAFPLILFHIVNMFDLDEFKLWIFTIPKLYRYRSDDISFEGIVRNIKYFFQYTLIYDGVKNISIKKYTTMYYISLPFIAIGAVDYMFSIFKSIKQRRYNYRTFIIIWLLAMFVVGISLGSDGPMAYRMNAVYTVYWILIVDGIKALYEIFKKYKVIFAKLFVGIVIVCYGLSFVSFAKYYFCDYTQDTYLLDWYNFKLNDPIDYLNEQGEDISNRTTYIGGMNFTYIFFLGSEEISPMEYNELVDDKPYTLWLWTQSYKNYRFDFPEEIDPTGNYIVPETCLDYIELYEQYGFEGTHVGQYYVFTNPWLEYDGDNVEAIISWDHGVDESGHVILDEGDVSVISGWALDGTYGKAWDDIIVEVDGEYYVANKMEREDVATIMGNQDLILCGFHVTIDTTKIDVAQMVRVIYINYNEKSCYVQVLPLSAT
jgi:hypothetical protein